MHFCLLQASEVFVENLQTHQTPDLLRRNAKLYRPPATSEVQPSGSDSGLANANAAIVLFCYNRCAYMADTCPVAGQNIYRM